MRGKACCSIEHVNKIYRAVKCRTLKHSKGHFNVRLYKRMHRYNEIYNPKFNIASIF